MGDFPDIDHSPQECPDIETASEGYAKRFSGRSGRYFLDVQAQAVRKLISLGSDTTVLDVGGGHGQLTPILAETGADITVFGSADTCHARLRGSPHGGLARYVTGNLLRLPFRDQSYDTVISVRLISHISDWRRLIGELCRVARQTVIIDYPSWRSLNALTPMLFPFKRLVEGNTRTYTNFRDRDLVREFAEHGFTAERSVRQFFIPMVVHRALDSPGFLRGAESGLRAAGITALFGSPVVYRFDRKQRLREPPAGAGGP